MKILSDRLKTLRGATSQAEMARLLNMKQPQWARYESGASTPSADLIEKICRTFSCSSDWLLGLREDSNVDSIALGTNTISATGENNNVSLAHKSDINCGKCIYKKKLEALEKLLHK